MSSESGSRAWLLVNTIPQARGEISHRSRRGYWCTIMGKCPPYGLSKLKSEERIKQNNVLAICKTVGLRKKRTADSLNTYR